MTFPKLLIYSALILFGIIGIAAYFKKNVNHPEISVHTTATPLLMEIELDKKAQSIAVIPTPKTENDMILSDTLAKSQTSLEPKIPQVEKPSSTPSVENTTSEKKPHKITEKTPEADRINEFFNLNDPKFPIVETITYKSRVSWQKGRPAWLSDYANHYKTSRHFIARSLNGKPDYLKQDLGEGARFNILNPNKNIHFNLIVDTSRCKMWFYYHDLDTQEKVLVKTYPVGLGRVDHSKISGLLTPLGVYSLGSRIAVYSPKMMGTHNGAKVEMIRVFGTRWIPFEKEISHTTAPAKGFGIHGLPWVSKNGVLLEDKESLEKYESDGCIRMATADVEELYAIIISRPTTIEIVKDFFDAENKLQTPADIANK